MVGHDIHEIRAAIMEATLNLNGGLYLGLKGLTSMYWKHYICSIIL